MIKVLGESYWAVGTKVVFLGQNGYPDELIRAKRKFYTGQILTVADSDTGGSSSTVSFDGYHGLYNTVMFMSLDEMDIRDLSRLVTLASEHKDY